MKYAVINSKGEIRDVCETRQEAEKLARVRTFNALWETFSVVEM